MSAGSGDGSPRLPRPPGSAARAESKSARLLRWLSRVREPVIVFTEYSATRSSTGAPDPRDRPAVDTLHGGLERGERSGCRRAFNARRASLLATDAAAEGLNLQHHCRIVVHYELPWRPLASNSAAAASIGWARPGEYTRSRSSLPAPPSAWCGAARRPSGARPRRWRPRRRAAGLAQRVGRYSETGHGRRADARSDTPVPGADARRAGDGPARRSGPRSRAAGGGKALARSIAAACGSEQAGGCGQRPSALAVRPSGLGSWPSSP